MTRRLTQEEIWIAKLFRAACANGRVLGRLGISLDPSAVQHSPRDRVVRGLEPLIPAQCGGSQSTVGKREKCGTSV